LPRATIIALNRRSPKRPRRAVIYSFRRICSGAARCDTNRQSQPIEHLGNSLNGYKRLTKPSLDHQSDTLGIRSGQRMAPLALNDVEHFRVAHAAEALDEILFRDRIAAGGQDVGVGLVDDRLAVDEHPVAVENDQLETAGNHSSRSVYTPMGGASRSI
jgi:hypothetical protein